MLLGWYITKFATSYPSFNDDRNPFLSAMLPIAFQTPCLLKAMLAVAGTQASREQPDLLPVTLQCRIGAIRGLRTNLSTETPEAWGVRDIIGRLACSMTLFIYEKIECEERALRSHLSYAASLVARLLACSPVIDDDTRFLIQLFLHNDIYAAFALRQPPTLDCIPEAALSHVLQSNTFPRMMASVARLASTGPSMDMPEDVWQLSSSLTLWRPSMNWLPSASRRRQTTAMETAAQVHQCAAITSLDRSLGLQPDNSAARSSLDSIYTIPDSDSITASLLWPTVVLGAEITDLDQRRRLQGRLHMLGLKTGFKQYFKALQLLEDCWEASGKNGAATVSWIDVMHDTGNILLCAL
ncbi:hypothetical protein NKR23_g6147 [Pleurostoma richardsiae]|uniref:Uncharacterized protein n=1 Tax=Pleurostoma richardsiae TaxID=41990 RepID=A0AA38RLQ2_9PEZI|nr:hypothetical protein NKR23_g6147 [Pleurostoma richardsiae]